MKKRIPLIFCLILSSVIYGQVTYAPSLWQTNCKNCAITKVELTKSRTIVSMTYTKTRSGLYQAWVSISSSTYIRDRISGEKYRIRSLGNDKLDVRYKTKGKKGSYWMFELIFPPLPPGVQSIDVIEPNGFYWKSLTIKNPDNTILSSWDESSLKADWSENGIDPIEGLYEMTIKEDNIKYRLAVKKNKDDYNLIYLGGNNNGKWSIGDVKAILTKTASPNIYKTTWFMSDKTLNEDLYISFSTGTMKVIWTNGNDQNLYLKLYPTSSDENSTIPSGKSTGTGFAISSNGYIVTNHHVIKGAKKIDVLIADNSDDALSAKIIISDEKNDLAILKIDDPNFQGFQKIPFTFRKNLADVGENIFVLGYPLTSSMGSEIKLTNGIVNSKTGFKGDISTYQISAPIQPGNSGGPLFDNDGNLIGIVNAKHTLADNVGYAIKLNYLNNLLQLLDDNFEKPKSNLISGRSLPNKVKVLGDFVFQIVVNDFSKSKIGKKTISKKTSNSSIEKSHDFYYNRGLEKGKNENWDGAFSDFSKAIELDPNKAESYYLRGYILLYGKRNYDESIKDLTKAIQMKPSLSMAYFYRGMAYHEKEDHINAIKDFSLCIEGNNENVDALFMRALEKSSLGDRRGAITDYEMIISLEKKVKPKVFKMSTVYNNKAYSLVGLKKYKEALIYVNKALKMDEKEAYIWDTRGEIYFYLQKYKEAIKDMDKAISIQDAANSYFIRGLSKIEINKKEEGCNDLSKAGELGKIEAYKSISAKCN